MESPFNKIYFGKIVEEDTCVTIEEYIPGKFTKYVNNNGLSIPVDKDDNVRLLQKAECFAHYTYVKSGEKLMVLDIQGSGYRLYDPEIASTELVVENELLFCVGNLSNTAIQTFLGNHKCIDNMCRMFGFVE